MMSESTADQNRIEHDLERTRSRMDDRLNELQERLSPGKVLDDLMGYFRGSEGGDFARNLMDSVRSNPMPAALTGIGLAWLMASNPQKLRGTAGGDTAMPVTRAGGDKVQIFVTPGGPVWTSHDSLDRHIQDVERAVVRRDGETEAAYRGRIAEARGTALGVARQAQDTHESFAKRVQDALTAARQSVTQGAHDLRDRASDATHQLGGAAQIAGSQLAHGGQTAQRMGSTLLSTITDSPVLLGAVSLAVGALLGALVPQSDQEEAALGGLAAQARGAARDLAQDVVDRGGQVAQQALDTGQDSAHAHGLTRDKTVGDLVKEARSGDLVGNVKQVAQDVLKAGDEAVRKTSLGQGQDDVRAASSTSVAAAPSGLRNGGKGSAD